MFTFPQSFQKPSLPSGFILERQSPPSSQSLNRLLFTCNEETFPPRKLALAIKSSTYYLSILEKERQKLVGFVRATSDKGLNANLWNLVAEPGNYQDRLLAVLVHRILETIKQEMPGCSISISASPIAIVSLKQQGFLIDPAGIRAMGLKLR